MSELNFTVTPEHTARAVGSGDLDEVLGTPVLIAWCEAATCAALDIDEHLTSVGTHVDVRHLAPSAVGSQITVRANITHRDERRVTFAVDATQGDVSIATGSITRAIVDRERFVSRL